MKLAEFIKAIPPAISGLSLLGPEACNEIPRDFPLVFVDGGARHRLNGEGFSVGDNDSFAGILDEVLPQDKDYSDFAYALSKIDERFEELRLIGFLGGRRDHELINLGEVDSLLRARKNPLRVNFDRELIAFSAGQWNFDFNGLFSLFAFSELRLSLEGDCRYPLSNEVLRARSSRGLSNNGAGSLRLSCDGPLFVFLNSEKPA